MIQKKTKFKDNWKVIKIIIQMIINIGQISLNFIFIQNVLLKYKDKTKTPNSH